MIQQTIDALPVNEILTLYRRHLGGLTEASVQRLKKTSEWQKLNDLRTRISGAESALIEDSVYCVFAYKISRAGKTEIGAVKKACLARVKAAALKALKQRETYLEIEEHRRLFKIVRERIERGTDGGKGPTKQSMIALDPDGDLLKAIIGANTMPALRRLGLEFCQLTLEPKNRSGFYSSTQARAPRVSRGLGLTPRVVNASS